MGDFEIHVTVAASQAASLADFAKRRGVKFSHIQLSRGTTPVQPMLTIRSSGTLAQLRVLADQWRADLTAAQLTVVRVKIEAAPWNEGVPATDEQAPAHLYFEHHVKVLLPPGSGLRTSVILGEFVENHDARVSRNARRTREDGTVERFVTQRCRGVGRVTARARLDALLAALAAGGYEVVEVEEEYVVHDDALKVDEGWFESMQTVEAWRPPVPSPGASGTPRTYRMLKVPTGKDITQSAVFDPALKQFVHAYRAGEPVFSDPADGERWSAARRAAMAHVLAVVAGTRWAENLVLRGSVVLRAWFGAAAREPGDLDFVVTPRGFSAEGAKAEAMLDGLVTAVAAAPGAGLRAHEAVSERIWTYDRVPGRRLVFPFDVPDLPQGVVQVDLVFNEHLPEPPVEVAVPPLGTLTRTASPLLSLAWKLNG